MESLVKDFVMHWIRSFVLWTDGWKRRKCGRYKHLYIEWKDPESGLWFSEGTAMKLVLGRAKERV
jgi:hypothetical protein